MNIRNFGRKSLNEVKDKLAQLGLALKKGPEGSYILPDTDDEEDETADFEDEAEVSAE
jgi:DNA-directed RNA polymerase subunit alpha